MRNTRMCVMVISEHLQDRYGIPLGNGFVKFLRRIAQHILCAEHCISYAVLRVGKGRLLA